MKPVRPSLPGSEKSAYSRTKCRKGVFNSFEKEKKKKIKQIIKKEKGKKKKEERKGIRREKKRGTSHK